MGITLGNTTVSAESSQRDPGSQRGRNGTPQRESDAPLGAIAPNAGVARARVIGSGMVDTFV
jgi:hypothetical protein